MTILPLPLEYERSLITKAKQGDHDAYLKLRQQFDQLIDSFSNSSSIPGFSADDVKGELELAFHEAMTKYDFTKGARFITHLHNCLRYRISAILKELKRDKRRIVFEEMISLDSWKNFDSSDDGIDHDFYNLVSDPRVTAEFEEVDIRHSLPDFNETEIEVLDLIVQGYKNTEIGKIIGMRPWRAGEVRQTIIKKLGKRGEFLKSFGQEEELSP